ncbi:peptidoglycan-associated lipoprotein Pal [Kaarinaea lacus]
MKFWTKITLAFVPVLFLIGCGTSGEVKDDEAAAGAADSGSSATTTGAATDDAAGGQAMDQSQMDQGSQMTSPLDDPNSMLAKRVVYFDFDRSEVKGEFRAIVSAHAEYLASNPDASVTIEGHADERGTREYNIALGERRAAAVKQVLTLQGASSGQVNTISYGEERPAALGHDEDAWALNRRAEFIYQR